MKIVLKNFILINIIFLITILTCLIPREKIVNNIQKSADFYKENNIHEIYEAIEGIKGTTDDTRADAIILSMLYEVNAEHPVISATQFWHYSTTGSLVADTFSDDYISSDTIEMRNDYYRYWHSYTIPLRILFVFFTLNQIKFIYLTIYLLLNYFLIKELKKNKMNSMIWIYIISSTVAYFHFSAVSIEYIPAVFITLISSIYMLKQDKFDWKKFIIIGSMTCMFDFLTIEIVCFSIPFLFILEKLRRKNIYISLKEFLLSGTAFVGSYGMTYLYKWLLASIILKKNCFIDAIEKASIRTGKIQLLDENNNLRNLRPFETSYMNIKVLFPFDVNWFFVLCFLTIIIFFTIVMLILFKKDNINKNYYFIFIFLFILPYIRYSLLENHSFEHYFFTFRAQIISIMVLLMIWVYGIDWKKLKKKEE